MQQRSFTKLALGLLIAATFFGCSSDLDVRAPYKEITVVYGLLDRNEDTVWVKVNKAFLGEGNALEYAQIADSNEYTDAQFQGTLEKVATNGNVVATATIQNKIVERPLGIFNGPQHKMYYVTSDALGGIDDNSQDFKYRLKAVAKGNAIEAITPLVNELTVYTTTQNIAVNINFRTTGGYVPYEVKWDATRNGKRYEVSYRFNYTEEYADGTPPADKSFTSIIGTVVADGNVGEDLRISLNGELFYQAVATNVPQNPNVVKRVFQGIDLLWAVAGPDLHTYLVLANPISGIVEERPDYSNISGGYGLFSSRLFRTVGGGSYAERKKLENESEIELVEGPYTGSLNFCIPGSPNCP
jgi:hypothetical protein